MSPPPPYDAQRRSSSSPASDESSIIEDLSFEYIFDAAGNVVRRSKGSSKGQSTPPTPPIDGDSLPPTELSIVPSPAQSTPPAPLSLELPLRRTSSLSRSEMGFGPQTAPTERERQTPAANTARSFQRVASGPASSLGVSFERRLCNFPPANFLNHQVHPHCPNARLPLDPVAHSKSDVRLRNSRSKSFVPRFLHRPTTTPILIPSKRRRISVIVGSVVMYPALKRCMARRPRPNLPLSS